MSSKKFYKNTRKNHYQLWDKKIVTQKKGALKKYKKKLTPLTENQKDMVRGILLSGKGDIRKMRSENQDKFFFQIEENLDKADFIYFCWRKFTTKNNLSWVNLRPRVTRKKRYKRPGPLSNEEWALYPHVGIQLTPEDKVKVLRGEASLDSFDNKEYQRKAYKEIFPKEQKLDMEKLHFNTFTTDQFSKINLEFQGPRFGGKLKEEKDPLDIKAPSRRLFKKRSKKLPFHFEDLLTETVLSFWFLGAGYQRQGYFFIDLQNYLPEERSRIIRTINLNFDFKVDLFSNKKEIPGQKYIHASLQTPSYGLSPRKRQFSKEDPKEGQIPVKDDSQMIVQENNQSFQLLIQNLLRDLDSQEQLFRKSQSKLSLEHEFRLTFDFADEFEKEVLDTDSFFYYSLTRERGEPFENKYSSWSFKELNKAAIRKGKLIKNYYSFFPTSSQ